MYRLILYGRNNDIDIEMKYTKNAIKRTLLWNGLKKYIIHI